MGADCVRNNLQTHPFAECETVFSAEKTVLNGFSVDPHGQPLQAGAAGGGRMGDSETGMKNPKVT
jgi:hypothetical protein